MNNDITPSFYSIIPADLRYDNRLKATEKLFFSEISALTNVYGYCYAGNKYFAKLYNCDVRTITRWISSLEKLGYIKIELIRDERKMIVQRRIYIKESMQSGIDKNVHRGIDKKVLSNNIYINNIINSQKKKANIKHKVQDSFEQREYTKEVLDSLYENI